MELRFKDYTYEKMLDQYDLSCLRFFPKCQTNEERIQPEGKVIYLRHDIDSKFRASVAMAEYEAKRGIQSTYFALHFSDYWNDPDTWKKLKDIQDMGHEIAFHNAVITEVLVDHGDFPPDLVSRISSKVTYYLDEMRSHGLNVRGTSAHGHPTCVSHNYGNGWIWDIMKSPGEFFGRLKLADFDLDYDSNGCYRDVYHSDSGNEWNMDPKKTADIFRKSNHIVLMLNFHPQWWL